MSDAEPLDGLELQNKSESTQKRTERQLLDLNEAALEALTAVEESQTRAQRDRARRMLKSRLVAEIMYVGSVLQDTPYWADESLGSLSYVDEDGNRQQFEFRGLRSIIQHRDGVSLRTLQQTESPGRGPNTTKVVEQVRPIPVHVLENAVWALQDWRNSVDGIGLQVDDKEQDAGWTDAENGILGIMPQLSVEQRKELLEAAKDLSEQSESERDTDA